MTEPEQQSDATPDVAPDETAEPPPKRRLFRRRNRDASAAPEPQSTDEGVVAETNGDGETSTEEPPAAPKAAKAPSRASIKRDLRRLTEERQESQFHLGGLALELFRRDALSDPVLRQKASQVIDIDERVRLLDWRLEAIETERRQRKGAEPPVAGSCLSCGADFAPSSVFCWRCGTRFAPETEAQSALTTEIGTLEQ